MKDLDTNGDGQVDFEEFVTLLGPKLTAAGLPDKFHGTDFDSVFWKVLIIQLLLSWLLERRQQSRSCSKSPSAETFRLRHCMTLKENQF